MNTKKPKAKRAFVPSGVDHLEERVVLSTASPIEPMAFAEVSAARTQAALPILTSRTLDQVTRQVDRAFTRAAGNGNIERLAHELSVAAGRIPYGRAELLPVWLGRLETVFDRESLRDAYQGVRTDFGDYIRDGVDSGIFAVRQSGNLGRNVVLAGNGRGNGFMPVRPIVGVPTLTTRTLEQVIRQVDRAFTRAAGSGNIERLRTELSIASSRLPYGRVELLPLWLGQVDSVFDRESLGAAYHGVRADLASYVQFGVESGMFNRR